ncbi:MAG: hypothetical protein QXP20_03450, partial [Candidatus Bathyarchaeia archaeon]
RSSSILYFLTSSIAALVVYILTSHIFLAILTFATISVMFSSLRSKTANREAKGQLKDARQEMESFFLTFSAELKRGNSPEMAFRNTLQTYNGPLRQVFLRTFSNTFSGLPLAVVLNRLQHKVGFKGCKEFLFMISKTLRKNSQLAGENISKVVLRLREDRKLDEEREHLLKALLFKVKILTIAISASLALLVSMLPLFLIFTSPISFVFYHHPNYATETSWLLGITLSLCSALSAYYAALAAIADHPRHYAILSLLVFWAVFTIMTPLAKTLTP